MKAIKLTAVSLAAVTLLSACATTPMGPMVRVTPAPNKSLEAFQVDQAACKEYAKGQVAGQADAANNRAVGSALVGAALGAGIGAVAGGGRGAAVGAAAGGGLGTAVGASDSAGRGERSIQVQYDNAYAECMTTKGNQVQQTARTVTVVHPVYAPPPAVIYAPPPTVVYSQPAPTGYAPPAGAIPAPSNGAYAPPSPANGGYAPPAGAVPAPPGVGPQ